MKNNRIRFSLLASFLIHILLLIITWVLPSYWAKPPAPENVVEFDVVPPQNARQEMPKQVVDQDEKAINEEIPDKAKYLSQHNQVVKHQTVATNIGQFQNHKDKAGNTGSGGTPQLDMKSLTPRMDFSKMVEHQKMQELQQEKNLTQEAQVKGQGGSQASQTSDYVKDVEKGTETLLSTREFVYYTFYARIRRQLNEYWSGKIKEKLAKIFKEGRSIASENDHVTKVLIILDRKGTLQKVQVISNSGVRDLDDAAVEAFKEAAPFPNPPAGIVESDGTIKIRWDFILEA